MKLFIGKRSLSVLLVTIVALTLVLGACSSNNEPEPSASATGSPPASEAPPASSAAATDVSPYAEHLDITWLGPNFYGIPPAADSPTKRLVEEKFNVTLTLPQVDTNNVEQFNLYLSEGKTADFYLTPNDANYLTLLEQGALKEIDFADAKAKMPNYFKVLEQAADFETIKSKYEYEGKNYTVPFTDYAGLATFVMAVRQDWMTKLGITAMPANLDEYTALLRKFTFDDPDGNGKQDTYGTHGVGAYTYAAFGIPAVSSSYMPFYVDNAGKVYPVATTDNKKELLKQVAAWYKEGLVDPEMVTDKRPQQRAKWKDGKFGVLSDHPWWYALSTPENLTEMPKAVNPNAEVAYMEPYEGPHGKGSTEINLFPFQAGLTFGKDTTQEKMDRIMAIKEALVSDVDFYLRVFYGVEGEHYDLDQDGKVKIKPDYAAGEAVTELGINAIFGAIPVGFEMASDKLIANNELDLYKIAMEAKKYPTDTNFNYTGKNEDFEKYAADLKTIVGEFDVKAITGAIDIDAAWPKFVETFMAAGGQKVTDTYQQLYDASK